MNKTNIILSILKAILKLSFKVLILSLRFIFTVLVTTDFRKRAQWEEDYDEHVEETTKRRKRY